MGVIRMYLKKTMVTVFTVLCFGICWIVLHWDTPGYLSSATRKIYFDHGGDGGYFSLWSFLLLDTVALLFYVVMRMQDDTMHIVIRYLDREEIWKFKIFKMFQIILQFTVIQFGVDLGMMLLEYPVCDLVQSRIVSYLALFFPNVFFYYVFFICVFFMCQTIVTTWKAFLCTASLAVLIYLSLFFGIFSSWNPLFFLSLLKIQICHGVNEADLLLSYINILSIDVVAVLMGLKRYQGKDFIL